jgi:hypothetical protein
MLLGILGATADVYRRQLEPQSWAESRCQGVASVEIAETKEWDACLDRQRGRSWVQAEVPPLGVAIGGMMAVAVGVAIVAAGSVRVRRVGGLGGTSPAG